MEKAAPVAKSSERLNVFAPPRGAERQTPDQNHTRDPIFDLQRKIGNQSVIRMLRAAGIQPSLEVSEPDDPFEQEADRVADGVLPTPFLLQHSATAASKVHRKCADDPFEHDANRIANRAVAGKTPFPVKMAARVVQRLSGQTAGCTTVPPSVDRALASPGMPLEPAIRQEMEQRFGHDFSRVRVHSDAAAAQSALDLDAHAYTVGQHIAFSAGRYAPGTRDGMRLIAHELTHVVQQSTPGPWRGSTSGVLQRKPGSVVSPVQPAADPAPLPHREGTPPAADTTQPGAREPAPVPRPESDRSRRPLPRTHASVREVQSPGVQAPPTELRPGAPFSEMLDTATEAGAPENAIEADPASPVAPAGDSSMPHLRTLLADRRAPAVAQRDSAARDETSQSSEVDMAELLGALAFGAGKARKAIHAHAVAARAGIDRNAKTWSKKLDDQTKSADDAVRALASERQSQIDRTVLAHHTQINWLEKACREEAATYANNAKTAQREGFAFYRGRLANVFDHWSRTFDNLNQKQSDYLLRVTEWNIGRMWEKYSAYNRQFIQGIGDQSESRREVQRDAAQEVVNDYIEGFEKTKTEILPELAKACENVKVELRKGREQALSEYDKGLPLVLKGIDEQHAAALEDIGRRAREARDLLAEAAVKMHKRVESLEETALKRNSALRTRVDGQIKSAQASAEKQFRRAEPEAMEPIAAIVDGAVGVLTATDEALDPDGSQRFVAEVVDFTLAAADATEEVFGAARDTGIGRLADAVPFAKRGFAAGKKDLETTLHAEGVENESALISFGIETEKYVRATLTDLDQTFNTGVQEAEARLTSIVTDVADKLREPMESAKAEIRRAVRLAVSKQSDVYWHLGRDMHNAAREAAWRYDHPYLKRVVDVVEFVGEVLLVALGFVMIVGILVGVAFIVVALFGELAAAFLGGFLIGYFGAQAYEERRKTADRLPALLGAIGDITGINEARRAFTDPKMKPFDRGVAWGGFWLGLVGLAPGASRFLKVIKVRLPETFTNPFRLKRSMIPTAPEAPVVRTLPEAPVIPETPTIGFKLPHQGPALPEVPGTTAPKPGKIGFELPHQELAPPEIPGTTAPKPGKIGFKLPHQEHAPPELPRTTAPKPGKIGFELPHQKLAEPEIPRAPGEPKPKKAGFKLPHEQAPSPEMPGVAAAPDAGGVTPKLHHRKPAVPEAAPSAGKRRIGFVSSEEPASTIEAPSGTHDQPVSGGEAPETGGVISDMPRAREVSGSQRPSGGTAQAPVERPANVVASKAPETPRATHGETPAAESPSKGSVVSTVEPEPPAGTPEVAAPPAVESHSQRVTAADERVAETRRVLEEAQGATEAAEARVKSLQTDRDVAKRLSSELGSEAKEAQALAAEAEVKLKAAKRELEVSRKTLRKAKNEAAEVERVAVRVRRDAARQYLDEIRAKPAKRGSVGEPWDHKRFPEGPGRRWRPGDPPDMPTGGNYPTFSTVRERVWRNLAHNELEARRAGAATQYTGRAPDITPVEGLTDAELIEMQRTGTRRAQFEIEHSRIPQRVGRMFEESGLPPNEARRLAKTGDPSNLDPLPQEMHAVVDERAHQFKYRNPTLKAALDDRIANPLRSMRNDEIQDLVNAIAKRGVDLDKTEAGKKLRAALQDEKSRRGASAKWGVP